MPELTPLQIMLSLMRKKWRENDYEGAVALAKTVAPYLHAKMPASRPAADLAGVSDDELDRFERDGGAGSAGQDPVEPG